MNALLLVNLLVAGYNFGTIWAHEVDIFRTWRHLGRDFREVQTAHWRKLPYWVFAPVAAGLTIAVMMVWEHPTQSPWWGIWGSLGCQVASLVLTAFLWGPWQAKLASDPLGSQSPHLTRILQTHWLRTALYTANAVTVLLWAMSVFL